jgi:hypothetical protein
MLEMAPSRKKIGKEDVVFSLLVHESPGSARCEGQYLRIGVFVTDEGFDRACEFFMGCERKTIDTI